MDYATFLAHFKTVMEAWKRENPQDIFIYPDDLLAVLEQEMAAELKRGELAMRLSEPIPPSDIMGRPEDPWRCAQCGEVIMYGERQHVCRGE